MDNIYSYETSEFQEISLHPAPESCTSNENHTHNWRNITVAGEIGRGNKLREKKRSSYRRREKAPIGLNLTKTCSARKRRKRKSHEGSNKTCPGCSHWITPPCSKSIQPSKTRPQNAIIKFLKKGDISRRCSMRTAELAVPTKRHCIDTWRTKSYLLPELMVERLKHQVLDLQPVVKIPDALYCFQKRKRRLHKKSTKNNNITNNWKNEMQMPLRSLNTETLCLLFAQKIIQKLSTPWKVSLNSELEMLYRVVGSDITQIANGKKDINTEYLERDRSIHSDIISKITLWIVGILEDLANKQLEEDLRDLEEEEGPVLDFLDDLVDRVLNLCPSVPSIDNNQEDTSIHSSQEEASVQSGSIASEKKETEDTDSEHFRNEISNIINDIQDIEVEKLFDISEGTVISHKEYFEVEITKIINSFQEPLEEKPINFPEDNGQITDKEHFQNEIHNLINNFIKDEESNDEQKSVNDNEETNSKYFENEIFNIISIVCKESKDGAGKDDELQQIFASLNQKGSEMLSEDTDDRSKKVMFSISDIVNPYSITRTSELNSMPELQESQDKLTERPGHKHNIVFGKPNEHLLSDADEPWPSEKFSAALLRPSASVTKSITSLGKFSEDDEYNMLPSFNSVKSHEILQNDKKQFSSIELHAERLDITLLPEEEVTKRIEANQTPPKEALNEKLYVTDFASKIGEKIALLNNELQEENIVQSKKLQGIIAAYLSDKCDTEVQTDQVKIPKEAVLKATDTTVTSFESKHQVVDKSITGKDKKIEVIAARNKTKVCKNQGICTEQYSNVKTDNEWKVKLETAPSWLTQSNAHGEPSEDFIPTQGKLKLTQSDIHKWCRDLDNGFKNLDIWRDWLQNTCQEAATLLKKKKERQCAVNKYTRIWRKLKSNVNIDALLWGKINQQTHETFQRYQKYKANIKIVPSKRNPKCVCINTLRCNI